MGGRTSTGLNALQKYFEEIRGKAKFLLDDFHAGGVKHSLLV